MKKFGLLLIGLLSMAGLLWWADIHKVMISLLIVDMKIVTAACLMQLVTIFLINIQWQKIARQIGEKVSLGKMFYMNMAGTFVESVTPAVKAGGEAVKVVLLRSHLGFSLSRATALVGLQKTVSLFSFFLLTMFSLLWFLLTIKAEGYLVSVLMASFLFLVLCLAILALFLLLPHKMKVVLQLLPARFKFKTKLESAAVALHEDMKNAFRQKKELVFHLVFALLIWLLFAVKAYFIAWAFNIEIGFPAMAVVTFLTYMVAMVPISPGGLGTFEGSMIFLLAPLGIPLHEAIALALVLRFVTFWFVFLISALYLGYLAISKILLKAGYSAGY